MLLSGSLSRRVNYFDHGTSSVIDETVEVTNESNCRELPI